MLLFFVCRPRFQVRLNAPTDPSAAQACIGNDSLCSCASATCARVHSLHGWQGVNEVGTPTFVRFGRSCGYTCFGPVGQCEFVNPTVQLVATVIVGTLKRPVWKEHSQCIISPPKYYLLHVVGILPQSARSCTKIFCLVRMPRTRSGLATQLPLMC